jgi:glycosyltransferase involved in cell wall biosynthesis
MPRSIIGAMLVSTIIPTYNRAQDVVLAVESALGQTYPAELHEVLVIDDGSTDDTEAALAPFGHRIRYLRKTNGGVSAARNHGLSHVRGDAVAFLDSDDEWHPEKIARQVALLQERPDIAMVLTDMHVVDEARSPMEVFHRRSTIPEDGWVLHHVLRNPAMTPSTAMIRTQVARELGGFDTSLRTAEDLDFHLRLALHHQVAVIPEPLVRYMRSSSSLSSMARSYHDYVFMMERFLRLHDGEISADDKRAALFGTYVRNARGLIFSGEISSALKLGAKSLGQIHDGGDVKAVGELCLLLGRGVASRAVKRIGLRS